MMSRVLFKKKKVLFECNTSLRMSNRYYNVLLNMTLLLKFKFIRNHYMFKLLFVYYVFCFRIFEIWFKVGLSSDKLLAINLKTKLS